MERTAHDDETARRLVGAGCVHVVHDFVEGDAVAHADRLAAFAQRLARRDLPQGPEHRVLGAPRGVDLLEHEVAGVAPQLDDRRLRAAGAELRDGGARGPEVVVPGCAEHGAHRVERGEALDLAPALLHVARQEVRELQGDAFETGRSGREQRHLHRAVRPQHGARDDRQEKRAHERGEQPRDRAEPAATRAPRGRGHGGLRRRAGGRSHRTAIRLLHGARRPGGEPVGPEAHYASAPRIGPP